jgi:4-aminobutyrate aminotransferase-like enzyme
MLSQTAVIGIGHCHQGRSGSQEQADKSFHILTSFINDARILFSEKLAAVAPGG